MSLTAERAAIAATIATAGMQASAHVPARPVPPFAMVVPGSPYVSAGDVFGSKALRVDVWIVAPPGDNADVSDALDGYIDTVTTALEADDLVIESVSQPIEWQPETGGQYLVAIASVRADISTH